MNHTASWFGGMIALLILGWQGPVRASDPAAGVELIGQTYQPASAPSSPELERSGLIGGAGIYYLKPFFKDNPAFSVSTTTPTGPGGTDRTVTQHTSIDQQMEAAPLVWLGYVSDSGLGVRARWWYFRQWTNQGVSVPDDGPVSRTLLSSAAPLGFAAFTDNDGGAAVLAVSTKLQLHVWDAEVLSSVQLDSWNLLAAGGVRFAQIDQRYNAFAAGDSGGGTGNVAATVLSQHRFNGAGPVVALEARRCLGDSPLSLYGSARGAVLFGSATQDAADIFTDATGTFIDNASDRRNSILPVGELELGLETGGDFLSSHAFGQIALVGQQWWSAGNSSRSVNTNRFGVPNGGGSSVDSDLGFLGLTARMGLNY